LPAAAGHRARPSRFPLLSAGGAAGCEFVRT